MDEHPPQEGVALIFENSTDRNPQKIEIAPCIDNFWSVASVPPTRPDEA
jgi:hypothetical protein